MLLLIVCVCGGALGKVRPQPQFLSWPCIVIMEVKSTRKVWVRKLQWLWVAEWPGLLMNVHKKDAFLGLNFCRMGSSNETVVGLGPSSRDNTRTQSCRVHTNSLASGLYTSLGGWGFVSPALMTVKQSLLSRACGLWRLKWRPSPRFSLAEWGCCVKSFSAFSSSLLKRRYMQKWTSSDKLVVACTVAGKWKRFYSWDDISVLAWKKQCSFKSPWAPIKCLIFYMHHK